MLLSVAKERERPILAALIRLEDPQTKIAKASRVADNVHPHDLILSKGYPQSSLQLSMRSPYESDSTIDNCRLDVMYAHVF